MYYARHSFLVELLTMMNVILYNELQIIIIKRKVK